MVTFIDSFFYPYATDGFVDKARVEEAEQKVTELDNLVSASEGVCVCVCVEEDQKCLSKSLWL